MKKLLMKNSQDSLCHRDCTHQILPHIEGIGKYNKSNWQVGMLTQRVGFERFGTFAFLTQAPLHTWLLSLVNMLTIVAMKHIFVRSCMFWNEYQSSFQMMF